MFILLMGDTMNYTIKELSILTGLTTRTLRYYDEIQLFVPLTRNDSGYRIYSSNQLDKLQAIMFYKELGFNLSKIKQIIYNPNINFIEELKANKILINQKRNNLDNLLDLIQKTILKFERNEIMNDNDKFKELKENIILKNESKYGKELASKYSKETIDESYEKIRKMSSYDYQAAQTLGKDILELLEKELQFNNPLSDESQRLCKMHQEWINYYWPVYTKEAHLSLCEMYVNDERFTKYYDSVGTGASLHLYKAMKKYLQK